MRLGVSCFRTGQEEAIKKSVTPKRIVRFDSYWKFGTRFLHFGAIEGENFSVQQDLSQPVFGFRIVCSEA